MPREREAATRNKQAPTVSSPKQVQRSSSSNRPRCCAWRFYNMGGSSYFTKPQCSNVNNQPLKRSSSRFTFGMWRLGYIKIVVPSDSFLPSMFFRSSVNELFLVCPPLYPLQDTRSMTFAIPFQSLSSVSSFFHVPSFYAKSLSTLPTYRFDNSFLRAASCTSPLAEPSTVSRSVTFSNASTTTVYPINNLLAGTLTSSTLPIASTALPSSEPLPSLITTSQASSISSSLQDIFSSSNFLFGCCQCVNLLESKRVCDSIHYNSSISATRDLYCIGH